MRRTIFVFSTPRLRITSAIGTFRTQLDVRLESVIRFKADTGEQQHRGLFKEVTLNRGRPMSTASAPRPLYERSLNAPFSPHCKTGMIIPQSTSRAALRDGAAITRSKEKP